MARCARLWLGGLAGLVGLCGLGLLFAGAAAATPAKRVAVLPIVVHSDDAQTYLQEGLADMLASRLGRAPGIAVIRIEDATQATTNAEAAQAAGREVGAQWVLFGSFTRFGEGASLDMRCVPVEGEASDARSIFIQAGRIGDIIPRLEELSGKVARHVGSDGLAELPAVGSASEAAASAPAVRALEERVKALEDQVFAAEAEKVAERDLGAGETPELR